MVKGIYVDLLKRHGPMGLFLPFDVDLTLRDTMSTDTPADQHALVMEFYLRTGGGVAFMTGRSSASVDKTFSGKMPGSYEHHSALRLEQYGDVISLAPRIDTARAALLAERYIGNRIAIARNPQDIRSAEGHFSSVYPEVKQFAVALVHSLGHTRVEDDRVILIEAAQHAISEMGLEKTHKIAQGNDAIEIVPKGLCPINATNIPLSDEQKQILMEGGLHKGAGIHNFMSHPLYANRTPFKTGDSGTDGIAINVSHQSYGGGGIWILNGKTIPDAFSKAVDGRTIPTYLNTWDEIEAGVHYLRSQTKIISLPNPQPPTP